MCVMVCVCVGGGGISKEGEEGGGREKVQIT